jgi:hypothetical protein
MNYRSLTDADLVDFAKNVEKNLTDHKVTCLDKGVADDLAAALSPLNASFETKIEESAASEAATKAVNAEKREQRAQVEERLATVQSFLTANKGPESDYDRCGFNYPKAKSTVIANDPTELTAFGTSNGVNSLAFKGNNKSGSVVYEIWRRHGDDGPWGIIATTKKQNYADTPVTPGQYYEYKVRAAAAKSVSNYSNSAVVYGAP